MSTTLPINKRLASLRGIMKREQLAAYIIPSFDPHQSEYVHPYWKAREWLSQFTGSAGTLLVTQDMAVLWTDSRYYTQAALELQTSDIKLYTEITEASKGYLEWLTETLKEGETVGVDSSLFSVSQFRRAIKALKQQSIQLRGTKDLIAEIWQDRPELTRSPVFEYDAMYSGKSRTEKIALIRQKMKERGAAVLFLSDLADIAWALNLRGADVACNPVFISYLWIAKDQILLFSDSRQFDEQLRRKLKSDGIRLKAYEEVENFLSFSEPSDIIWIDPSTMNHRFHQILELREHGFVYDKTPPTILKAQKNTTEVKFIKKAMLKDGVALLKLFMWLEGILDRVLVTEYEVSRQLNRFRQAQGNYFGESFSAIVGYKANGAIAHYKPGATSSQPMRPDGLLLLDSGGQYLEGTTDITRTVHLGGEITSQQRQHYTLVLKGHIALANAIFPEGTSGVQLDTFARQFLWQQGLNYGHGTGHGVGFFLNVHEGPQSISPVPRSEKAATPIRPGMLMSNEPGLYIEGEYGIRIENLILCVEKKAISNGQDTYLGFETLSLYPYDSNLIDSELLSKEEVSWINGYHQHVFEALSPFLNPEELNWLEKKCEPLR